MSFLIPKLSKIVMIGDSITDCGRLRPNGEGKGDALGNGYVSMIHALIDATYPDADIRIVNMGIGGDTVRELASRWQSDVIELHPDWVSLMIGTNDVWRQYNRRLMHESHIGIPEYENTLKQLIETTIASGVSNFILMSPFYIEANKTDSMRMMLKEYTNVVRKLANLYKARFIDTQQAFDIYLTNQYSATLALDRVHPNATGHMILARAWLKELDYAW